LPLAFICAGLGAYTVGSFTLALNPGVLLLPVIHPHVIALAHLWLPGFLLSVCLGAIYQLMPVVLGAPLQIKNLGAWTHWVLHLIGASLLAGGFLLGHYIIVAIGGTLVMGGAVLLFTGTWRTFLHSQRRDAIAWSLPLAVTWLAATTLSGVAFALNRHAPFLPISVVELLRAHAHAGLGGFFLTLLQGTTFQLIPMFTMAEIKRPRFVVVGLILSQWGLIALLSGFAFQHAAIITTGAVVVFVAVGFSGVALVATLRSRRRRVLDPGVKAFTVGATLFALTTAGSLALAIFPRHALPSMTALYGVNLIGGALSAMVLGMVCKIVPFLVWMRVYGPRAGRQPVPLATALGSRPLELSWLALHGAAIAMITLGLAIESLSTLVVGTSLLAASAVTFLGSITRVLAHLWRPQNATPHSGRSLPVS
jgi:hypothetical protein